MLDFLKTHMGDMVEVSAHGVPSVSGRVRKADDGAVVLETEQGEVAVRPDSIVMAKTAPVQAVHAHPAENSSDTESSLVVPQLNQRSGAEGNIL